MNVKQHPDTGYSSAAERNKYPILEQLKRFLPHKGTVLEIGSGTGQHALFYCRHLAGICWQTTDRQENLSGLKKQVSGEANPRILPPLELDVLTQSWPDRMYEAAYSSNTAHIMSWMAVKAMFAGVAEHLMKGASFCLYGPFNINGQFTAESNARFDTQLRAGDPEMGIRDMSAIEVLANSRDLYLEQKIAMPANNFVLLFVKK